MIIAIHPDKNSSESYSEKWAKFLGDRGVDVKYVDLKKVNALEEVKGCNGVMWRWVHSPHDKIKAPNILYAIENYLGIPVFPDHNTCWHYDNKVAQYYLLNAAGVPIPQTWIFWDKHSAIEWANKTKYPTVFKLSAGAASQNVIKVSSEAEAIELIEKMFDRGIFPMTMNEHKIKMLPQNLYQLKSTLARFKHGLIYNLTSLYPPLPPVWWQPEKDYIYFQEFITDNIFDTRITVIGNRAFGFRRFNRKNDFRASGSGNLDMDHTKVDMNFVKMAFEISKKLKFQSMAYDFLFKDDVPVITEISYTYADWAVEMCEGHWDSNLNWIPGKMWPEEAQVEDFIKYIRESGKENENRIFDC